jgi:predicted RNase H-like nuclease
MAIMGRVNELLTGLDRYREHRLQFLHEIGTPVSNREPLAEFAEQFVAGLTGGRGAHSRVQAGWDVEVGDERIQVRFLANPAGRWINEHLVYRIPGVQWYTLVLFEELRVVGVLAFPNDLTDICSRLEKRHPRQAETLQLTQPNWQRIRDNADTFRQLGMRVWLPPFHSPPNRPTTPLAAPSAHDSTTIERFLGVDLAWREATDRSPANETGVVSLDRDGRVLDAGWTRGATETMEWIEKAAGDHGALVFVDAPLVVDNPTGMRVCERQVGQRYNRWGFSANATNLGSAGMAGVRLRGSLEQRGWRYDDGWDGPPREGRVVSECYPFTALVGAPEFGYHVDGQRPRYKRKPRTLGTAEWRVQRAATCDELIRRLTRLGTADPALLLDSHPTTRQLVDEPSPIAESPYKHRENLIDGAICAWTALLWWRHGMTRCQVLGPTRHDSTPVATIIAPATPDQRR